MTDNGKNNKGGNGLGLFILGAIAGGVLASELSNRKRETANARATQTPPPKQETGHEQHHPRPEDSQQKEKTSESDSENFEKHDIEQAKKVLQCLATPGVNGYSEDYTEHAIVAYAIFYIGYVGGYEEMLPILNRCKERLDESQIAFAKERAKELSENFLGSSHDRKRLS